MFRLTSLWLLALLLLHVLSSAIPTNYSEATDGGEEESAKVSYAHHHEKGIEDLLGKLDGFTKPATAAGPDAEIFENEMEETHLEDVESSDQNSDLDGEEIEVEEMEAPSGEGYEAGDEKSDLNVGSSSEDLTTTHKVCTI